MSIHYNKGDALRGERVLCEAREVSKPILIRMTGGHRGSRVVLRRNVTCVIDEPMI